jgi:hypothetical protein
MDIFEGSVIATIFDASTEFSELFKPGIGCTHQYAHRIRLKDDAVPSTHRQYRLPLAIRESAEVELRKMVADGVIEPITSSTWLHPMVVVKNGNKVRICCDLRSLNKAVIVDHFPLPTIDEIYTEIQDAKVMSKIDLRQAYHHMPLTEDCRDYTAFNTHIGSFRYKRLPMGLVSAASVFQKMMTQILSGVEGVVCYQDDILIFGADREQHDKTLREVLRRLALHGLRVNKDKCVFHQEAVEFLGHTISAKGIQPKRDNVAAIQKLPTPDSTTKLRTFLGMCGFYSRFIPSYSSTCAPLYDLLKKDTAFEWTDEAETAFQTIKKILSDAPVLATFNAKWPIIVSTDASQTGLGACLIQNVDGEEKIVSYASRTLSECEKRYAVGELEALACVFACERWHLCLYGRKFLIRTDHKSLISLLTTPGSGRKPMRYSRWYARLLRYTFEIEHVAGQDNVMPDMLSRLPANTTEEPEVLISAVTITDIQEAIKEHEPLQKVVMAIQNKWTSVESKIPALAPYRNERENLFVEEGMVWKFPRRMVIPDILRMKLLRIAHQGHPGIVRTKRLLRQFYWWPGMDRQVEEFITHCNACQLSDKSVKTTQVPNQEVPTPDVPWQKVAIDICGPFSTAPHSKRFLLVMTDYYSKWPEVKATNNITSVTVIKFLNEAFARYGLPQEVVSDNGPQFTSADFEKFLADRGILHNKTAVYNPCANGRVERLNRTMKESLQACLADGMTWEVALNVVLITYRNTPLSCTSKSPAELILNYAPRTPLTAYSQIPAHRTQLPAKPANFKIGDRVRTWLPSSPKGENQYSHPKAVRKQIGTCTWLLDDGKTWNERKMVACRLPPPSADGE